MNEKVKWWIDSSKQDEAVARMLLKNEFYDSVVFHIQQCAVKLLKAAEIYLNEQSNNLMCKKILDSIAKAGIETTPIQSFCRKLDVNYADCRFPYNGPTKDLYDEVVVVELFICLERIQNFCNNIIK